MPKYTILIQAHNNAPIDVDAFTAREAFRYENWYAGGVDGKELNDIRLTALYDLPFQPKDCIPIGTVEFVHTYLGESSQAFKPLNIPKVLQKEEFLLREIKIGSILDVHVGDFVKSNTKIKSGIEPQVITSSDHLWNVQCTIPSCDELFISKPIDIVSEWRIMVMLGKVVGCQNYDGDFFKFPDVEKIKKMAYLLGTVMPKKAYTLDVGILKTGETVVIECHDFYSVGLYGFANYKLLPSMYRSFFSMNFR